MSMEQLDEKLEHLSAKLAELENQRRKIKNKRPLNKKQLKDKEEEIGSTRRTTSTSTTSEIARRLSI